MPNVYIETPDSFEVEDFLNAFAAANDHFFFILNPKDGHVIDTKLVNIPIIGISTQNRSKTGHLGYVTKTTNNTPVADDHEYQTEALLVLEMAPGALPANTEGESWALQVRDQEAIPTFLPIAKAIAEKFNVNIFITPAMARDDDKDHLREQPVNPAVVGSPLFNPLIIRKTEVAS